MPYSKEIFINYLEEYYGERDSEGSPRFGGFSAKSISEELKLNQSQYSRMVSSYDNQYKEDAYRKACEKLEYLIKIKGLVKTNKDLVVKNQRLEARVDHLSSPKKYSMKFTFSNRYVVIGSILFFLLLLSNLVVFITSSYPEISAFSAENEHQDSIPIETAFLRIFDLTESEIVPYRKDKLPEDFPCVKYQGRWSLQQQDKYKIPLPVETIKGFHYQSNEVIMFSWCETNDDEGKQLTALEILKNEIWFDLKELGFDEYEEDWQKYMNVDFYSDSTFIHVADVYSLFTDEFLLEDSIYRVGKRWARYKPIPLDSALIDPRIPERVINDLEVILQKITQDYIGSLILTDCNPDTLPASHPFVEVGITMSFNCNFYLPFMNSVKTVPYSKHLTLVDQYVKQE